MTICPMYSKPPPVAMPCHSQNKRTADSNRFAGVRDCGFGVNGGPVVRQLPPCKVSGVFSYTPAATYPSHGGCPLLEFNSDTVHRPSHTSYAKLRRACHRRYTGEMGVIAVLPMIAFFGFGVLNKVSVMGAG